jgi:tyrosyl-tRNA synthetase
VVTVPLLSSLPIHHSVKTRLPPPHGTSTSPHAGLSYTEFSYQLLQAYDFYLLNSRPEIGCSMQIGGSDQMGNISAGVELIRRKKFGNASNAPQEAAADLHEAQEESPTGAVASSSSRRLPPAFGMTLPLLTTSSGAKLGKSAGNAIFLSRELCSDYDFYQYLLRTTDEDVTKLLNCLTFLSSEKIAAAEGQRGARQVLLADEVTRLFRGAEALESAKRMTSLLHVAFSACEGRGGLQETLDSQEGIRNELHLMASLSEGKDRGDAKVLRLNRGDVLGQSLVDVLVLSGLVESKGECWVDDDSLSQPAHDLTAFLRHLLSLLRPTT